MEERVKMFIWGTTNLLSANALNLEECKILSFGKVKHLTETNQGHITDSFQLTHSHTMTPFEAPGKQAFLKTLWEKEKLPETSNFSFSHSVFHLFG